MGRLESPTVVTAVPAHDDLPAQLLQTFDQLDLLFRQHPGEDLAAVDHPLEQLRLLGPDQPEGRPVTGEHVLLAGHVLDLAGGRQDAGSLGLGEAVGDDQLVGAVLRLHPDDGLVRLDQPAVPAHADGRLDVVPGHHEGRDVGRVQLRDGAVGLSLDQVLHDDQTQEVGPFLQLASA